MYCRHCGKEISGEAKYCGFCGGEQFESARTTHYNLKALLCFFVSILAEILVIAGSLMKLVNIEFHISQDMWGNYSVQKNIFSLGIFDILGKNDVIQYLCSISDSFSEIYNTLIFWAVILIVAAIACGIYMIVYLSRYSYSDTTKKASVFGTNFERYSSIPSIILTIIMVVILIIGSRSMKEINEYVSVKPAIGTILICICTVVHIIINLISSELRTEKKINKTTCSKEKTNSTFIAFKPTWACSFCGMVNQPDAERCTQCGQPKDL